jgi:predicted acylesterase/phospholipase RssA
VDDAEQQQQDDQEPRHAEDPQQERNHLSLLSGWTVTGGGSQQGARGGRGRENRLADRRPEREVMWMPDSRPRRILAIDGGGVRGIIPATVLASLERATGTLARDQFDFVAGTSTGAVIAGAVAAGIPAERLASIYRRRGPELFRSIPILGLLERLVAGHQYDVHALHRILGEELGQQAGWRVNDVPLDILVTAVKLSDGHPWYFVKDRAGENSCRTGDLRLLDCVTASAAAPTYFAPWVVPGVGTLVDGGAGVAGNPVYQACVEAFEFTGAYTPASTVVVSLGTGRYLDRRRPTWLGSWLQWVLSELFRSPSEQQTELVQRHYGEAPFYRIDVRLPHDVPLDTSGSGLDELQEFGESLARSIDWAAVLAGSDEPHRVRPGATRPEAYCRIVST